MEASKSTETNNIEPIRAVVRCRPFLAREVQDQRESIVKVNENPGEVIITNPKPSSVEEGPKTFSFQNAFGPETSQSTLYNEIASPIVDSVLQGYNGTIFAYGQTSAGKTYTIQGNIESEETKGIIPRAFEQIFNYIQSTPGKQFLVQVSCLEIYNEQIYDLLNRDQKKKLRIREKTGFGVYVEGLLSLPVENIPDASQKLAIANQNKIVQSTKMSTLSSRSHTIFLITVECSEAGPDGKTVIKRGKLNLVDLAGSERQGKTGATGTLLKEAINIGISLNGLGSVISALSDPKARHVPYRNSTLTRFLQESLGGNAKTVMVANIGPADWNYDETISTLRYTNRAKLIMNKPMINEVLKGDEFQGERITVKEEDEKKTNNLEEKKKMIEAQKDLADAERQRLLADLASKEEEQKVDNKEKILSEIESLKKKLEEKSLIEQKLAQKINEQEAELRFFRTAHGKLEEKNRKIDKLSHELQEAKAEIEDLQKGFDEERKLFQEEIDSLYSQLILKDHVCIPQQDSNSKL